MDTATGTDPLRPSVQFDYLSELSNGLLIQAQWQGGMPYLRDAEVPGTVEDPLPLLPPGAELRLDQRLDGGRVVVAAWPGLLAEVDTRFRVVGLRVVGTSLAAVEDLVGTLRSAAARVTELPEDVVRMRFWSLRDRGGGQMSSRRVEAPTWADVAGNYARRTAAGLTALMATTCTEDRAGRLVLWHGAPGTGKTTAARALSRAWSSWCRTHYVMDPERLFADPHYLLQVAGIDDDDEDDDGRWRLVVAEDCDEYLRVDAKERAGASLGRLLNLCDGILGHGLRVLVLLTTNEDVGRLHPAITRPGRCLSQVEFEPLSAAEARAWLGAGTAAPEAAMTLAQLYAVAEQRSDTGARSEPGLGGYL